MNNRKIGIIVAISIVGIVISFLIYNSSMPEMTNSNKVDSAQVTDSAIIEESGRGFFLDEEGKKVYIIEANDSPSLGDG